MLLIMRKVVLRGRGMTCGGTACLRIIVVAADDLYL